MRLILEIVSGPMSQAELAEATRSVPWLRDGQSVIVGRSPYHVDMSVTKDQRMSSRHFRVSCESNGCRVEDLQSTNGTFVNGVRIDGQSPLADGDQIMAGLTVFSVQIADADSSRGARESIRGSVRGPAPASGQLNTPPPPIAAGSTLKLVFDIVATPGRRANAGDTTFSLTMLDPGEKATIGRDAICDLGFPLDEAMSPRHVEVRNDGDACRMSDLSQGSTLLNGEPANVSELKDGDRITAGATTIVIRLLGQPSVRPAARPAPVTTPIHAAALASAPAAENPASAPLAARLRSTDAAELAAALSELEGQPVATAEADRIRVAEALATVVKHSSGDLARRAAMLFCKWTPQRGVVTLLSMLEHPDAVIWQAALRVLANWKEQRLVDPLAELLESPTRSDQAVALLVGLGPPIEDLVLRLLLHSRPGAQIQACRVLQTVGGARSVLPLQTKIQRATAAGDESIAAAARVALAAVQQR